MIRVGIIIFFLFVLCLPGFSFAMNSPYYPWEKTFTEEKSVKEDVFARLLDNVEESGMSCQVIVRKNGDIEVFAEFEVEDRSYTLKNEYHAIISSEGRISEESSSLENQMPDLKEGINKFSREIVKTECINDIDNLPLKVKKKINKAFGIE